LEVLDSIHIDNYNTLSLGRTWCWYFLSRYLGGWL